MSLTLPKELAQRLTSSLNNAYEDREAGNIAHELLRHYLGIDRVQLSMNDPFMLNDSDQEQLEAAITRLLHHEPLQHILGTVEFYGLTFKIDGRALIPRPETEELVHWIIEDNESADLRVLDIGTGTGCIPIALAKKMHRAKVKAIDVSAEALALASENARFNQAELRFEQADILKESLDQNYDIIVSNPPYIPEADRAQMRANVLEYEPALALFVSNDSPLLFYKRIAHLAWQHLSKGGKLYFEIHHAYGLQIVDMLRVLGFEQVILRKDLQDNDRMIKAVKP